MTIRSRVCRRLGLLGLGLLLLAASTGAARAAVSVALTPNTQSVAPGSDFDVFLDVVGSSSSFNGYDAVVVYDTTALTFLPLSPTTAQQGCLMTGACSPSCGNTFHVFSRSADSLSIDNVLLCNGVSLNGPGRLYKLRFRASNTPQTTSLTIRRTNFYNAGLIVSPVTKSGCSVGIGVSVGVGNPGRGVPRPLRVEPNPAFGTVHLVSEDDAAGLVEARIVDVSGRVVRQIGPLWLAARARLTWDGRDRAGAPAPPGLYLVDLRRAGTVQSTRVVLLP